MELVNMRYDKPSYILGLLLSVTAVSVKTLNIVEGLSELEWK